MTPDRNRSLIRQQCIYAPGIYPRGNVLLSRKTVLNNPLTRINGLNAVKSVGLPMPIEFAVHITFRTLDMMLGDGLVLLEHYPTTTNSKDRGLDSRDFVNISEA